MSCSHSRFAWAHLLSPFLCGPCVAPWMGETPPTGAIECFNEHPNVEKRLAIKQTLTSFSTEVEEGWRITVMLSISIPAALIIPSASAMPLRHCLNDRMSLVLSVQHAVPVLLCSAKFASFRQTTLSSQLSSELIGLCPKSSNDEGYKLRPLEVVSFSNTLSAEQRSPETKASDICPFSKPGQGWAAPAAYHPSIELVW